MVEHDACLMRDTSNRPSTNALITPIPLYLWAGPESKHLAPPFVFKNSPIRGNYVRLTTLVELASRATRTRLDMAMLTTSRPGQWATATVRCAWWPRWGFWAGCCHVVPEAQICLCLLTDRRFEVSWLSLPSTAIRRGYGWGSICMEGSSGPVVRRRLGAGDAGWWGSGLGWDLKIHRLGWDADP